MHREQLITTVAQIAIESGERRGGEVGRVGDCTIVLVRDRRMEEGGTKEKGISLSRAIVKLSSCSGALSRLRNSARAFRRSTVNNLSDYTDHD